MTPNLKSMKGDEFIKKILAGERDFSYINLIRGFNLNFKKGVNLNDYLEEFKNLQDYLKSQNLKENPIDLTNSNLNYFKAKGIYLPYVRANFTNFQKSNLGYATLEHADFMGAHFENATLSYADLKNANVRGVNFSGSDFGFTDLRDVQNLDQSNVGAAFFQKTIVSEIEERIIRKAIKELDVLCPMIKIGKITSEALGEIGVRHENLSKVGTATGRALQRFKGEIGELIEYFDIRS